MPHTIITSDILAALADMPDNSFDGCFCDPPYELGFMGKGWDKSGIAFQPDTWAAVLRVLKPGAHLLAFGGSRTYHRLACAIEDAGFEARDSVIWAYGSGFPKSLDVSKAIDKAAGAVRAKAGEVQTTNAAMSGGDYVRTAKGEPITDAARLWSGYGTGLKPAYEPCIVARKPLDGTVAQNAAKWGVGALWIDGGRVGDEVLSSCTAGQAKIGTFERGVMVTPERVGRWPANLFHDGSPEVADALGDAARFFYCAKASSKERNAGCNSLALAKQDATRDASQPSMNSGEGNPYNRGCKPARNHHPCVKPLALCKYLSRLVLPPAGRPHGPRRLLVPFSGSGSEMVGALKAGWDEVIGIEREADYAAIADARLSHHIGQAVGA